MFNLNIANRETIIKFKLSCFYHILCSLQHKIDLKICTIKHQMHILDIYLFRFSHNSSLTNMTICNIDKINLIISFCQQPLLLCSCIIFLSLGTIASMKRIKSSIQIFHLLIEVFEIENQLLVINSIIFNCIEYLFYVSM